MNKTLIFLFILGLAFGLIISCEPEIINNVDDIVEGTWESDPTAITKDYVDGDTRIIINEDRYKVESYDTTEGWFIIFEGTVNSAKDNKAKMTIERFRMDDDPSLQLIEVGKEFEGVKFDNVFYLINYFVDTSVDPNIALFGAYTGGDVSTLVGTWETGTFFNYDYTQVSSGTTMPMSGTQDAKWIIDASNNVTIYEWFYDGSDETFKWNEIGLGTIVIDTDNKTFAVSGVSKDYDNTYKYYINGDYLVFVPGTEELPIFVKQ
jgi:hypothetical protein